MLIPHRDWYLRQAAQELLAAHPRAWFFVASNSQAAVSQFCAAVQERCLTFLGGVRSSGTSAPLSPALSCVLLSDFNLALGRASTYALLRSGCSNLKFAFEV